MPQLKGLSCTIQWADTGAPFPEHATVYGDGLVESFIVIPNKPQPFDIRLKSLSYIHDGLAMIVFIDGQYQSNRNRLNLRPAKKRKASSGTLIDFTVRQREKPLGDGVYMGRQWRFDNHNIGMCNVCEAIPALIETVDQLPEGVKESHFDLLGTIEVLVLRCCARVTDEIDESGSSSAADSDVLGERYLIDEDEDEQEYTEHSNKDGSLGEETSSKMGKLSLATDGTNDHMPNYTGWPTTVGTMPGGWPVSDNSRCSHGRSHSPHYTTGAAPYKNHTFPDHRVQQASDSISHSPAPPKRVHFAGDPPASSQQSHTHHRQCSHERGRPSTQMSSNPHHHANHQPHSCARAHGSAYGATPENQPQYHYAPTPQYYQPQPSLPPPPPANSLHFYQAVPQYALPGPYQSQAWPASAYNDNRVSRPYFEPPHVMYNPQCYCPSPWWPMHPNNTQTIPPYSNPTTLVGSSKTSSSSDEDGQQQSGANTQDQSWENSTNAQTGTQDNTSTGWDDSNQNNNFSDDWSKGQNNNGGGDDWEATNQQGNGADTTWTNDNSNTNGNNVNDKSWGSSNDGDQQNDDPENNIDGHNSVGDARALFGPHGQYYTYHPKGPDEPNADAEEEPRYDVPKKIAMATGSTKQVLPGSGYMYWKKRSAPEYLDTMEEPYARFVFKYRTKGTTYSVSCSTQLTWPDQLEKETGIKIEVEPTGDEAIQELQGMDKQALIEMLVRAKSALGGKVPSPRARPSVTPGDQGIPVPVEPPDHSFLRYSLPELRRPTVDSINYDNSNVNGNTNGQRSNNGTKRTKNGGSWGVQGVRDWNSNNNDTTWAGKSDWNLGRASSGNNDDGWAGGTQNSAPVNWNKPTGWDGAGENQNASNIAKDSENMNANTGESWGQSGKANSAASSPSTLPLDVPFDPSKHQFSSASPAHDFDGSGFDGGNVAPTPSTGW